MHDEEIVNIILKVGYNEEFDEMLVAGGGGDDSRAGCVKCAEAHNGVGRGVVQD